MLLGERWFWELGKKVHLAECYWSTEQEEEFCKRHLADGPGSTGSGFANYCMVVVLNREGEVLGIFNPGDDLTCSKGHAEMYSEVTRRKIEECLTRSRGIAALHSRLEEQPDDLEAFAELASRYYEAGHVWQLAELTLEPPAGESGATIANLYYLMATFARGAGSVPMREGAPVDPASLRLADYRRKMKDHFLEVLPDHLDSDLPVTRDVCKALRFMDRFHGLWIEEDAPKIAGVLEKWMDAPSLDARERDRREKNLAPLIAWVEEKEKERDREAERPVKSFQENRRSEIYHHF